MGKGLTDWAASRDTDVSSEDPVLQSGAASSPQARATLWIQALQAVSSFLVSGFWGLLNKVSAATRLLSSLKVLWSNFDKFPS